ncbi:sensor histidine kinase [Streptococcus sp. E17BB]|uniref:sensor histidine kinase n=1 Tax=Streptococcus sp. E17BB TaxID=3278714 RepID=UPI00359E4472
MLRDFFREYRWLYLTVGLTIALFLGQFSLYGLPMSYFLFSLWLVLLILAGLSTFLFLSFRRKMLALAHYDREILQDLSEPSERAFLTLLAEQAQTYEEEQSQLTQRDTQRQAIIKMWSHQMKIPLSALSLMVQTDQLNPQDVQLHLHHLDTYLANLLNYLKLSKQQLDFRFARVDVRQVIVDLVKAYRVQFLSQEICVAIEGDWQLDTDKKWFSFAIEQLLSNALKYNKPGGAVTISLSEKGLVISDTGLGILPEDLPRLGQEGFTGYNGHEYQKATGFGLYMTKTILTQLELELTITSQVGEGTVVTISKS